MRSLNLQNSLAFNASLVKLEKMVDTYTKNINHQTNPKAKMEGPE